MEKVNFSKLDGGTLDARVAEAKELFDLKPEQSFQDSDVDEIETE